MIKPILQHRTTRGFALHNNGLEERKSTGLALHPRLGRGMEHTMGWAAIWSLGLDQRTTPAPAWPHFPWPQLPALGPSSQSCPTRTATRPRTLDRDTRKPNIGRQDLTQEDQKTQTRPQGHQETMHRKTWYHIDTLVDNTQEQEDKASKKPHKRITHMETGPYTGSPCQETGPLILVPACCTLHRDTAYIREGLIMAQNTQKQTSC